MLRIFLSEFKLQILNYGKSKYIDNEIYYNESTLGFGDFGGPLMSKATVINPMR